MDKEFTTEYNDEPKSKSPQVENKKETDDWDDQPQDLISFV